MRNEEAILSEDDEDDEDGDGDGDGDDDSSEYEEEEAGANQVISRVTPPVARSEEGEEENQKAVVVEEKAHPLSRTPSPALARMAAALHLDGIKDIVSSDLTKERTRQRKYHSKRSARHAGRPRGSKAKLDTRVKLDRGGMWD